MKNKLGGSDCPSCDAEQNEADLRQDAKRRMKEWRKENDEGDGFITFVITAAVALILTNFVLTLIY